MRKLIYASSVAIVLWAAAVAQIPGTAAGRQFSAWLEAFNSGERSQMEQFIAANYPAEDINALLNLRQRTGGFKVVGVEASSETSIKVLVHEHGGDLDARVALEVEPGEPHRFAKFSIRAIPPPELNETPQRMTEPEVIAAARARFEKQAADDRFSGTVIISKNGKELFSGAYGMADREKKIPNKLDTRFRIGSMNKMFTAVSVLQLAQAGKVKLTDPFGKYIKDYPNQEMASKVTIHQLLTHTGGTGDIFGPEYAQHRRELKTLNDYIKLYGKRGLAFEPGSKWEYSNYGMVLLGVVIERVTGKSYYDYVEEHVYKPAGMTRSGSFPEDQVVQDRSTGYMREDTKWVSNADTLPYRGTAAGGGYSTVGDLVKFAEALMQHKLLNAEYTDLLITGKVESRGGDQYAYGFEDRRKDGDGSVGHSGGAPGMNGDLRIYPKQGYMVTVLSNFDPPSAQGMTMFIGGRLPR